jgi:hypothetical protein
MNGIPHTRALVAALRDGRKQQTRRIVNNLARPCMYKADQTYYVREVLVNVTGYAYYEDGMPVMQADAPEQPLRWRWQRSRIAARFCPEVAARGWVVVAQIRREPLHALTDADALAEGVIRHDQTGYARHAGYARAIFAAYWDLLYPQVPWASNPLVDVLMYQRVWFTDLGVVWCEDQDQRTKER